MTGQAVTNPLAPIHCGQCKAAVFFLFPPTFSLCVKPAGLACPTSGYYIEYVNDMVPRSAYASTLSAHRTHTIFHIQRFSHQHGFVHAWVHKYFHMGHHQPPLHPFHQLKISPSGDTKLSGWQIHVCAWGSMYKLPSSLPLSKCVE